ncbi:MAG TPA: acetylxylan esterase [Bryobacteraceae bacterium]|nr:acetylxylan esterase [Bryobacteraceae bacterium]
MRLLLALSLAFSAFCQIPSEDSRNVYTPSPDTHFRMRDYRSLDEWQRRSEDIRRQILLAAGLFPLPERSPLHPRTVKQVTLGGVVVETVLLETMPGYFLGGNLYRPARDSGKHPAVLSPHGHWKQGRLENIPSYSVPALGINLARQGYIVLAHDMVGYGDTRQTGHNFGGWREQLWSFNPMGLQLWNSIRALDYLESREDVDPRRIAVTGASGGGSQTIFLAAVDPRVRIDAPVNMVSGWMQGADPCEEAPNLRLDTSNVDFAAAMAPRPMLLISCTGDWTRNTPVEEFPEIRRIYGLYGHADLVQNFHLEARHNYNQDSREAAYRFFDGLLLGWGAADRVREDLPVFNPAGLLAQTLPAGALSYDAVFREWRESAGRRSEQAYDAEEMRTRLMLAFGAEWPRTVVSGAEGDRLVLTRPGKGDRVAVRWIAGQGEPTVVIHPDGMAAAAKSATVARLVEAHRAVVLAEVFQTGAAKARRNRGGAYFLSYNRTDDANRVQDILTVLSYVDSRSGAGIELTGLEDASIWCAFAAALAPARVWLNAMPNHFSGADEEFRERFFVPGIQRAGGWTAALKLLGGRNPVTYLTDNGGAPAAGTETRLR